MTTATRTLPDHGTRARYLRGCRCHACSAADYRYMSQYRLHRHRQGRRRTNATPAASHVQALTATGWQQASIARAAHCSESAIRALLDHRYATIRADIARRVLAIPLDSTPPTSRYVDATGTVRRLRALVSIGHPLARIAQAAGKHLSLLSVIARGQRQQVEPRTADAIAALYRRWSRTPGASQRARLHAQRCGWHGPLAWDDIDNPDARPEPGTRRQGRRDTAAEVRHLTALGESEHQIARALGCAPEYVHQLKEEAA